MIAEPDGQRPGHGLDRLIRSFLDHLSVERGVSVHTVTGYRRDLQRYAEFLTSRGIDDPATIVESDVTAFAVHARHDAGLAPSSVTRVWAAAAGTSAADVLSPGTSVCWTQAHLTVWSTCAHSWPPKFSGPPKLSRRSVGQYSDTGTGTNPKGYLDSWPQVPTRRR